MSQFDFEELISDMLNVIDVSLEDDEYLPNLFYDKFDRAYDFAKYLLIHTVPIEVGFSKKQYHTFISKYGPIMLMNIEVIKKMTDVEFEAWKNSESAQNIQSWEMV